jgi:hypothetical protein
VSQLADQYEKVNTMSLKGRFCIFALILSTLITGCTTNGYITSSVSTVVGLDVSENPKTQVPHVKFGYARTGLYYVPTGKSAYGDPNQVASYAAPNTDSVKDTPDVVSEIFVNSKFLTDITISEKFAIGPTAVNSRAAVATLGNPAAQAVATTNGTVSAGPASIVLPTKVVTEKVPDETLKKRIEQAVKARGENLDAIRAEIYAAESGAKQPVDYGTLMAKAPDQIPRTEAGFTQWVNGLTAAEQLRSILSDVKALPPALPR